MNNDTIKDALLSALSLLNSEFDSVDDQELREEYLTVIEKIETVLKEL